jgi:hypothetical protein
LARTATKFYRIYAGANCDGKLTGIPGQVIMFPGETDVTAKGFNISGKNETFISNVYCIAVPPEE